MFDIGTTPNTKFPKVHMEMQHMQRCGMQHMHQQKAHHVTKFTAQATDRISNDIPDGPWIADAEGVHLSEDTVARCGGINNEWFKNLVIVLKKHGRLHCNL